MKIIKYSLVLLLLILLGLPAFSQESDSLTEAYQREFIYLDNEIRLLEKRLEEITLQGESRKKNALEELDQLELKLLTLQEDLRRESETLNILEEEENSSGDAQDRLISIITQANSRLESQGRKTFRQIEQTELPEDHSLAPELSYSFSQSIDLLRELSSMRIEQGNFFLPSGKQVQGQLIRIGQIGAFGLSGEWGGTLAPAGEGRFHLVNDASQESVKKMIQGEMPQTLSLFLFESMENLIENQGKKNLSDTIDGGGAIGLIILGLGAIAVILIILRALTLMGKVSSKDEEQVDRIVGLVEQKEMDRAVGKSQIMENALGRVMEATLKGLIHDPAKVEDTIAESVLHEQPPLNRFRTAISVFAAVAPLLGLLGTVTGMISTFDIITLYGTGDPKLLSGGISEALVTTELGLVVAIPTLLLGNLLSSWSDSINSKLEVSAIRLVNASTGFRSTRKKKKKGKNGARNRQNVEAI